MRRLTMLAAVAMAIGSAGAVPATRTAEGRQRLLELQAAEQARAQASQDAMDEKIRARNAAAATRPTSRPTLRASETEGEVLGIKVVGKTYDPKTGRVTVELAIGNKSNKVMRRVDGTFTVNGDVIERPKGISLMYLQFVVSDPIPVGETAIVRQVIARLPSETDKEIDASRARVNAIETASYCLVTLTFSDGTTRNLD